MIEYWGSSSQVSSGFFPEENFIDESMSCFTITGWLPVRTLPVRVRFFHAVAGRYTSLVELSVHQYSYERLASVTGLRARISKEIKKQVEVSLC